MVAYGLEYRHAGVLDSEFFPDNREQIISIAETFTVCNVAQGDCIIGALAFTSVCLDICKAFVAKPANMPDPLALRVGK